MNINGGRPRQLGVYWLNLVALALTCGSLAAQARGDPAETMVFDDVVAQVAESYDFSGLASYYERVEILLIADGRVEGIEPGPTLTLGPADWLVAKGRFRVFAIRWPGAAVEIGDGRFEISPGPTSKWSRCSSMASVTRRSPSTFSRRNRPR
jgi:hypothetical protein